MGVGSASVSPTALPGRAAVAAQPYVRDEDFVAFYRREYSAVVGLAFVLSGSRSVAEDIAQDAFVAAYRQWTRIASYDDPGAWLRRVVANRSVSRFRRATSEAKALLRHGQDNAVQPEVSVEALALWAEVRRLPRRQAQAVALQHVDGRSVREVARILGCSENTVKTHVLRAKSTLAHRLREVSE